MNVKPPVPIVDAAVAADSRGLPFGRAYALRLPRALAMALAYLAVAVPAIVVGFTQPVWQLTDEAQHTDVLAQYAHGVYPVEGRTTLRPEIVRIMQATGNYRWSPPETVPRPAVVDPAEFGPPPPYLAPAAYRLWMTRHIWWFSYEAMQPPLFYLLATPVWLAATAGGGPFLGVFAVRVMDALLLGLLGPLVLLGTGLLAPARRLAGPVAVVLTGALPGLLLNGSQVTNDTLGAVLGGVTLLLAADLGARGWRPRPAAVLGVAFGLTMLTKLTGAGIAAGLAVAWAWPALRLGAPWLRQARMGAIAAGAGLAVLAPWFAVNLYVYGHPVPTLEAARLLGNGSGGTMYSVWDGVRYCWITFWTGEHRWTLPWAGYFAGAVLVLVALAIAGLARALGIRRRTVPPVPPVPPAPLAVFAAALAVQVAWAMAIPTVGGLGGMTPGRYVYPAIVPAIGLIALGLVSVVRGNQLAITLTAAFALFSIVNFAGYFDGLTGIRHVSQIGPQAGVATRNAYGEGTFNFVTVTVDRLVVDRRVDSAWAHVHVRNDSVLAADWTSMPDVRVDGRRWGRADYASSTPFPETLAPRSDYWGWIRLSVKPGALDGAGQIEVRFPDIAVNHYRDIGSIDFVLPLVGRASEDTHGH